MLGLLADNFEDVTNCMQAGLGENLGPIWQESWEELGNPGTWVSAR